mmetsp:Transcript_6510/g.24263  ORF Transcript_6510/g.24263 Transcript_6510/m.24263 type:complete len:265 (-) Transcript_6510:3798-4592(-)
MALLLFFCWGRGRLVTFLEEDTAVMLELCLAEPQNRLEFLALLPAVVVHAHVFVEGEGFVGSDAETTLRLQPPLVRAVLAAAGLLAVDLVLALHALDPAIQFVEGFLAPLAVGPREGAALEGGVLDFLHQGACKLDILRDLAATRAALPDRRGREADGGARADAADELARVGEVAAAGDLAICGREVFARLTLELAHLAGLRTFIIPVVRVITIRAIALAIVHRIALLFGFGPRLGVASRGLASFLVVQVAVFELARVAEDLEL